MPIYAYRCESCGHAQDVLQKLSDAPLTDCPACGQPTLRKQVTAAGFQLKGSGWYVTDFRDKGKAATKKGDGESKAPDAPAPGTGASDAAPSTGPAASPAAGGAPSTGASTGGGSAGGGSTGGGSTGGGSSGGGSSGGAPAKAA